MPRMRIDITFAHETDRAIIAEEVAQALEDLHDTDRIYTEREWDNNTERVRGEYEDEEDDNGN